MKALGGAEQAHLGRKHVESNIDLPLRPVLKTNSPPPRLCEASVRPESVLTDSDLCADLMKSKVHLRLNVIGERGTPNGELTARDQEVT